jgi:protein-S-isoprenylcysteine O-methyltransferase Ste14
MTMSPGRIDQALWIILLLYWAISFLGTKRTTYRYNPGKRLAVVGVLVLLIYADPLLPAPFQVPIVPRSLTTEWLGTALCALGVAFAIWARRTLGRNWSGNPTLKEGHELIQGGPYRLVRHPIYTGILTALLGTLLGYGSYAELLPVGYALVALHFKMKIEEGLMLRQFPESYPAYMRRTKKLIPLVW